MPIRVLLTGFDPFHGAPRNPSGDAARALDGARIDPSGAEVVGRVLPVLWDVSAAQIQALVAEVRPHVALSLGMAKGTFRVERIANDVRRPIEDNAGLLPSPLREAPATTLPTRLPVDRLEAVIAAAGGPVEPSEDAGGFICNEVFLTLLRTMDSAPGLLRAGFLHVPNDRHVPEPIAQESVNEAVLAAVRAVVEDLSGEGVRLL